MFHKRILKVLEYKEKDCLILKEMTNMKMETKEIKSMNLLIIKFHFNFDVTFLKQSFSNLFSFIQLFLHLILLIIIIIINCFYIVDLSFIERRMNYSIKIIMSAAITIIAIMLKIKIKIIMLNLNFKMIEINLKFIINQIPL